MSTGAFRCCGWWCWGLYSANQHLPSIHSQNIHITRHWTLFVWTLFNRIIISLTDTRTRSFFRGQWQWQGRYSRIVWILRIIIVKCVVPSLHLPVGIVHYRTIPLHLIYYVGFTNSVNTVFGVFIYTLLLQSHKFVIIYLIPLINLILFSFFLFFYHPRKDIRHSHLNVQWITGMIVILYFNRMLASITIMISLICLSRSLRIKRGELRRGNHMHGSDFERGKCFKLSPISNYYLIWI